MLSKSAYPKKLHLNVVNLYSFVEICISMELKDIVSVTGMPGLHKIVGQNKTGLILESLTDGKKFSTNPRQRVSILSDISMFEEDGEVRLAQVLKNIKALEEAGTTIPNGKAETDEARDFMSKALPNYDRERVYPSDMKKLFAWYHVLSDKLDFATLDQEEAEESTEEEKAATPANATKTADKPKAAAKVKTPTKTASGVKSKTSTPRKMGS